jgi:hypothetical protein
MRSRSSANSAVSKPHNDCVITDKLFLCAPNTFAYSVRQSHSAYEANPKIVGGILNKFDIGGSYEMFSSK